MRRAQEGIPVQDVELGVVHPVQEHVHPRQVVGRQVDLLSIVVPAEAVLSL